MPPMNEADFDGLCRECDTLLAEYEASPIARTSIPWLHVLNEHPSNISKYIAVGCSFFFASLEFFARVILQRLPFGLLGLRASWYATRPVPPQVDVLFVSHLLSQNHAASLGDFYFGNLPESVECLGLKTVVLLKDHSGMSVRDSVSSINKSQAPRVVFERGIGPQGEVKIALQQFKQALKLRFGRKSLVAASTRSMAAVHALSSATAETLRFYYQIYHFVKATGAATIVVTYEGHAWERIAFAAARLANPSVRCIGYHHAIFFPRQHAICRSLGSLFDPDLVAFAGEVSRDLFAARSTISAKLEVVGTHRTDAHVGDLAVKLARSENQCLVVPDGVRSECLLLLSFAIECAKKLPNVNFVVRMHPLMSFQAVQSALAVPLLPPNLMVSTCAIEEDFDRCRWVLYRGSGAGVRAATVGLRPFYLMPSHDSLPIDPLRALSRWRVIVSTPEDLALKISADVSAPIEKLKEEFGDVHDYLLAYFRPINRCRFLTLLK